MSKEKINTTPLSGMMELSPAAQLVFEHLKNIIETSYQSFGFTPLETPVIERSEVLLAKAGGETEKQIYRFMKGENDLSLRFDLTVPLARYVVEHAGQLTFPFRRYAIGKVYRGERAQKGRYREFYQCDVDVIGNGELDLLHDAEIISIMATVVGKLAAELKLGDFVIRINNRKLLNGFFAALGISETPEVLRVIDKMDKIGEENVRAELKLLHLGDSDIDKILQFSQIRGPWTEVVMQLEKIDIPENVLFATGLAELTQLNEAVIALGVQASNYCFDLAIARGLDYYTGTVFETNLSQYPELGSVCSGGRYEDLTGTFSKQKMPGVGTSIGLTRFFSQLLDAGIVSETEGRKTPSQVLILPITAKINEVLGLATFLRQAQIATEVYLQRGDLKKKLKYADALGIEYVLLVGDDEIASGQFKLKNMISGEQRELVKEELVEFLGKE